MVRQVTQRIAALSPKPYKPQRPVRVAPVPKSPLSSKGFHAKHARFAHPNRENAPPSRYLRPKRPVLPTILEEEEEDEAPTRPTRHLYKALDSLDNHDDDDDDMDWDEEKTLVSLLRDDHSEKSDTEDLAALADRLKTPMSAQSQQLKRYMVETIVPAVQRVKKVHDTLEEEVDMAYGTGLLAFDEVCKRVETMALRTEDELRSEYLDSKKKTDALVAQLVEAYRHRDALWTQLDDDLESCADRAKAAIQALPGDVETTIAKLEKRCKDMEKNANSSASKQKILKGLLERL